MAGNYDKAIVAGEFQKRVMDFDYCQKFLLTLSTP